MQKKYLTLTFFVLTLLLAGCASKVVAQPVEVKALENPTPTESPVKAEVVSPIPPADCPVSTAKNNPSFEAPAPYAPNAPWPNIFWFGSNHLWTAPPADGVWSGLPLNPDGYTQKLVWWSDGYIWNEEPEPALTVTGELLDASASLLNTSKANGVYASDMGSAMMVGADFPTLGCWMITGKYKSAKLSFVVWVAP